MSKKILEYKLQHRSKSELQSLVLAHMHVQGFRNFTRKELIETIEFLRKKIKEKRFGRQKKG